MRKKNQPCIKIQRSTTEKFLDIFAVAGLLFILISLAIYWKQLPAQIATHFNFSGKPDCWGSKNSLLLLPLIAIFIYILFAVARLFPHKWNYMVAITEENAKQQYQAAISMMSWLKAEIILLLAFLNWQMIQVALGKASGLGAYSMPVFLGIIFLTTAICMARSFRAR